MPIFGKPVNLSENIPKRYQSLPKQSKFYPRLVLARGGRGSSDERLRLNDQGNPPHGIDWVGDKFYEPGFYANFSEEQKSRLHELRNNRSTTTLATQKVASVESRLLKLEQLSITLPPPQPIVASHQGVSQVGVQPQYTNATNTALQQLNQRS